MKTPLRNPYSQHFSNFYDTYAQSDSIKITEQVNSLLDMYNPEGTALLELGCGTGKILESLPKRYTFEGLDFSKHMLAVAQKKFPKSKFYLRDMSTFNIKKKYDAIICFSDSINHLHTFSEWEKTFQHAYKHLKNKGVFIFDMNTPIRLERLSKMKTYVSPLLQDNFYTVKVSHLRKTMYSFSIQVFNIEDKSIALHEDFIVESSFPVEKVKKSLSKNFTIENILDVIRPKLSKKTGKAIFVCKKNA